MFFTPSLKPNEGIQRHLTGSKIAMSTTKVMLFGRTRNPRWSARSMIGWDSFEFSDETTERNSTTLDGKQDRYVHYQVCVFGPIVRKTKESWSLIDWEIFDFFFESAERNSTKLDRKQDRSVLYQGCVFAGLENKDGHHGLDCSKKWTTTFKPTPLSHL